MRANNALCCHKEKHKEPETESAEITKNKIVEMNLGAGIETTVDKSSRTECRAMRFVRNNRVAMAKRIVDPTV
jgi:hypothetical protein